MHPIRHWKGDRDPRPAPPAPRAPTTHATAADELDRPRVIAALTRPLPGPPLARAVGKVVVGTDASYPPNEFTDTDGTTIVGMDVDLGAAVAQKLGLTPEFQNSQFDGIIPVVAALWRARRDVRKPNRPTTTWPSSSAGSSSPPDSAAHAPSSPLCKNPAPSSQHGPPPEHDQQKPTKHGAAGSSLLSCAGDGSVEPGRRGTRIASAQHGDLVTEHQDFDVFGCVGPGE